jgi:transposase
MQDRRTYSDEVKVEALKMIKEQGLTLAEVGKRLSIPKGTIGNWVAGTGVRGIPGTPGEQSQEELRQENARLRKELAEARMEREILKKAAAYFAKESQHGTRS